MRVAWNLPLELGLTGLAVAFLGAVGFVARRALRRSVPRPWLIGLGILFLASVIVVVGSQVTVVSRLSADDPRDAQGEQF